MASTDTQPPATAVSSRERAEQLLKGSLGDLLRAEKNWKNTPHADDESWKNFFSAAKKAMYTRYITQWDDEAVDENQIISDYARGLQVGDYDDAMRPLVEAVVRAKGKRTDARGTDILATVGTAVTSIPEVLKTLGVSGAEIGKTVGETVAGYGAMAYGGLSGDEYLAEEGRQMGTKAGARTATAVEGETKESLGMLRRSFPRAYDFLRSMIQSGGTPLGVIDVANSLAGYGGASILAKNREAGLAGDDEAFKTYFDTRLDEEMDVQAARLGRGELTKMIGADVDSLKRIGVEFTQEDIDRATAMGPLLDATELLEALTGIGLASSATRKLAAAAVKRAGFKAAGDVLLTAAERGIPTQRVLSRTIKTAEQVAEEARQYDTLFRKVRLASGHNLGNLGRFIKKLPVPAGSPLLVAGGVLATGGDTQDALTAGILAGAGRYVLGSRFGVRAVGAAVEGTGKVLSKKFAVNSPWEAARRSMIDLRRDMTLGAVGGVTTASLYALDPALSPESRGSVLSSGFLMGGGGVAGAKMMDAISYGMNFAPRLSTPDSINGEAVLPRGYADVGADRANGQAFKKLSEDSTIFLRSLQDYLGNDGVVMVATTPEEYAELANSRVKSGNAGVAGSQGVAFKPSETISGKAEVILDLSRGVNNSPGHEVTHALMNVIEAGGGPLAEKLQAAKVAVINDFGGVNSEGFKAIKAKYEEALGREISNDAVVDEWLAEHGSVILAGLPLGKLPGVNKGVISNLYDAFLTFSETLRGRVDPYSPTAGAPVTSSVLQYTPSVSMLNMLENIFAAYKYEKEAIIPEAKPAKSAQEVEDAVKQQDAAVIDVGTLKPMPADLGRQSGVPVKGSISGIPAEEKPKTPVKKAPAPAAKAGGVKPAGTLTPEAEGLLAGIDAGGSAPAFISKNLERIARDNGIEITGDMRPEDVIKALRDKKAGATPAAPTPVAEKAPAPQRPKAPRSVGGVTDEQRKAVAGEAVEASPEMQAYNEEVLSSNLNAPFKVTYRSALAEKGSSADEVTRRKQRELADAAEVEGQKNPLREDYEKVFTPVKSYVRGSGGVNFKNFSGDKLIRNMNILRGWFLSRGDTASADKLFSPEFTKDIRSYLANQQNGYRGDGESIVRPPETDPTKFPPENPDYSPVKISQENRDLINALMGLDPVSLGNKEGKMTATQKFVHDLAAANGFIISVGGIGPKKNKVYYNPLLKKLKDAGFDPALLNSVIEDLRLSRMMSEVVPQPELSGFVPPVQGSVQAGFMPAQAAKTSPGNPQAQESKKRTASMAVRSVAEDYMREAGLPYTPHEEYAPVNEDLAKRLADFYDQAESAPDDPEVQSAYRSLADETMAQYRAMEAAGIEIEPWEGKGEPYANSAEMLKDVRDNKHLWFFTTESGFGKGETAPNALLEDSGVVINGKPLAVNDVFRAVHDYFGHAKEGYEFGPRGEFNAYLAHSRMFSDAAKPALASETLAQNSWVNFGPHLRREDGSLPKFGEEGFVSIKDRPFADQKNLVVPDELLAEADQVAGQFMPAERAGAPLESEGLEDVRMIEDDAAAVFGEDTLPEQAPEADAQFMPAPIDSEGLKKFTAEASPLLKNPDGTLKKFYHGSDDAGFMSFDLPQSGKTKGTGVFLTDNYQLAAGYTKRNDDVDTRTGGQILVDWKELGDRTLPEGVELVPGWVLYVEGSRGYAEFVPKHEFETLEEAREAFTELGYEDITPADMKEAINLIDADGYEQAYVDEKDLANALDSVIPPSAGIYELVVSAKDVVEIDWQDRNWDEGPPVWTVFDETGDPIETLYTDEEVQQYRDKNPDAQIEETVEYFGTDDAARQVRDMGADALLIRNVYDTGRYSRGSDVGDVLVVFDPNNIKATNSVGFDKKNPDIRYMPAKSDGKPLESEGLRVGGTIETDAEQVFGEGATEPQFMPAPPVESEAFKRWAGGKRVYESDQIDPDNLPSSGVFKVYHGTKEDFTEFKARFPDGLLFTSTNPEFSARWGESRGPVGGTPRNYPDDVYKKAKAEAEKLRPTVEWNDNDPASIKAWTDYFNSPEYNAPRRGQNMSDTSVMPLWANVEKAFDPTKEYKLVEPIVRKMEGGAQLIAKGKHKVGNWIVYENPTMIDFLKSKGYDAIWITESSIDPKHETLAVFSPNQLKSATGNRGTYDPTNPDIRYMPAKELTTQFESTKKRGSLGGVQQLVHFSSVPMKTLDPKKSSGKGAATPTDLRGMKRGYFYRLKKGAYESGIADRPYTYMAQVDGNSIYDLAKDPLGYRGIPDREKADQMLIDAGFAGMRGKVGAIDMVAMFKPVKVTEATAEDVYTKKQLAEQRRQRAPLEEEEIDYQAEYEAWEAERARRWPSRQFMPAPTNRDVRYMPTRLSTVDIRRGEETLDLPNKPLVSQIGSALAKRSRKILRAPYDSRTKQTKEAMATTLADELEYAMTEDESAIGWYERKIAEAMELLAQKHPELANDIDLSAFYKAVLAITSNGQAVIENFARADKLYEHWKDTGRLITDSNWGGKQARAINGGLAALQKLVDLKGLNGTREFLLGRYRFGDLMRLAKQEFGLSISGEKADYITHGSIIFGPKVGGGFFPNLNGDFSPVTMDMWLMRTWNRINGSFGQPDQTSMGRALAEIREAAASNPELPQSAEISRLSDRQLANWMEKTYTDWKSRRKFKDATVFDRPSKRFVEAKEGRIEVPRNASERAWVREIFSRVDEILTERGLPKINNADKQALLWYYEKELYASLGYRDKRGAPADYADAARSLLSNQ